MKVYVVQGEHPSVPGIPLRVCGTRCKADDEAADLVEIIAADAGGLAGDLPKVSAGNWSSVLESLQEYHGAANCWVEISEREVL